jgi:hypothetical protein
MFVGSCIREDRSTPAPDEFNQIVRNAFRAALPYVSTEDNITEKYSTEPA